MEQKKTVSQRNQLSNSKPHDSSSKLIFGNAELCSQFLRNYMDIPLLKNVRAEDIEDVTERYIPMFTEERNSDTVKRVKISENSTFYFVSLIEHKTKVDYNVSMQLLRYMVYIWEDYEREREGKRGSVIRRSCPSCTMRAPGRGQPHVISKTGYSVRMPLSRSLLRFSTSWCN